MRHRRRPGASQLRPTPVDCCNFAADDSDRAAGVRSVLPNVPVAGTEPGKDRGEDRPAVDSTFQNLDMDARRGAPLRADLDFPTAQVSLGVDDQRSNVLPN